MYIGERKKRMKKLVTEQTIKDFFVGHGKDCPFPVDENTLITPLAKDKAKSLGITFGKYGENSKVSVCGNTEHAAVETASKPETKDAAVQECSEKSSECSMTYDRQMIVEAVIKVLQERGILGKILE